jgi:hypothetical protein
VRCHTSPRTIVLGQPGSAFSRIVRHIPLFFSAPFLRGRWADGMASSVSKSAAVSVPALTQPVHHTRPLRTASRTASVHRYSHMAAQHLSRAAPNSRRLPTPRLPLSNEHGFPRLVDLPLPSFKFPQPSLRCLDRRLALAAVALERYRSPAKMDSQIGFSRSDSRMPGH